MQRRVPLGVLKDGPPPPNRLMTPLQAELLEQGVLPQPDALGASLRRADFAPEAGYSTAGPEPLPSPEPLMPQDRYDGWPPVFQWQIDPADPSLESGEAQLTLGEWDYDIWWQAHPSGLVYASLQALDDDGVVAGPERQHPLGRNVVVNLVYDRERRGVVAVYGTARDFRPFIDAFRMGCGIDAPPEEKHA